MRRIEYFMWAASEGILILLLVTLLLGILAAPARGKSRVRSRRDERIAAKVEAVPSPITPVSTLKKGASNGAASDYAANQKITAPPSDGAVRSEIAE